MSAQQLRVSITAALAQHFPEISVYTEGEPPQGIFFEPRLISAAYERQREDRTLAVYRFGISCKGGNSLEAEALVDRLQVALELIPGDEAFYRGLRQNWMAGEEGSDPLFTVEYTLQMVDEKPEAVMMGQMNGGERLK